MKGFLETFNLLILNLKIFDQMSMINEFADFLNLWWYGTPFNMGHLSILMWIKENNNKKIKILSLF